MIVNALHARPVLARTLPWYKDRNLRRRMRHHTTINAPPAGDKDVATDAPFTPPAARAAR